MAPSLQDLPEELVSNIAQRLSIDYLQALRLACKALEEKTLHTFGSEHFTDRGFIITTASLKVLLAIANSSKLSKFLRRIYVLTAYFSDSALTHSPNCAHAKCCGWMPTVRQSEAWKYFVEDTKQLKSSGDDKKMLSEALSKLPALAEVQLVDTTAAVPVDTDIAHIRQVSRLTGRNFLLARDDPTYLKVLSHSWSILTSSIANSGKATLTSFGTNLGSGRTSLCLPLDIRFNDAKIVLLQKAFANVETLDLQLTTRLQKAPKKARIDAIKMLPSRVQRLASTLPALQTLSLDFDGLSSTDRYIFDSFTKQIDLGQLKKLSLKTLSITRQSLVPALEGLTAVQDLCLNFVDLTKGSWIPILKHLRKMDDHLEHLHLMYLSENKRKVYFLAQVDEDEWAELEEQGMLETYFDGSVGLSGAASEAGHGAAAGNSAASASTPHTSDEDREASSAVPSPQVASTTAKSKEVPKPGSPDYHASADHKAPNNEHCPERGYYVCVRGKEEIQKQLSTFIQQYNIGDTVDTGLGPPPGVIGGAIPIPIPTTGPVPNVNDLINGLAGYFGMPPPPTGGGAGAGQGGAQQNGAGTQSGATNGTQSHATANSTADAAVQDGAGQGNATQGGAGQAAGSHAAVGGLPLGPAAPPASAAAGAAFDDEWDTEVDSSEFESDFDGLE